MLLGAAVVTVGGVVVRPWLDEENTSMVVRQVALGTVLVLVGLSLLISGF
jgi:hypothetical protein